MINRILLKSYIGQGRLLLCSLGLVLFAFAWVRVWVVSLVNMGQFEAILGQLKDFERFSPVPFEMLVTYRGRVGLTYDEPIVILCVVLWAISRGSDVVSGEIGRGTMEMLLAQPISRLKLLFTHALVSTAGLALLCAAVWAGIAVGVNVTTVDATIPPPSVQVPFFGINLPVSFGEPQIESFYLVEKVDPATFAASTFNLFAFGFFLLGLSTLFSCFDRFRWRTIGCVMSVYVVQLIMFGLGKAAEVMSWLIRCSFFNCYQPQIMSILSSPESEVSPWSLTEVPEQTMIPPLFFPLILLTLGIVSYLVGAVHFKRRDLPAPL